MHRFEGGDTSFLATYCTAKCFKGAVLSSMALLFAGCESSTLRQNELAWSVESVVRVGYESNFQRGEQFYKLGLYYDGQKRSPLAESAYRKAIHFNPEHMQAHNALGVLLAMRGAFDESIQELQTAARLAPDQSYVLSNLGYAYLLSGQTKEAANWLNQALWIDPTNAKAEQNFRLLQKTVAVRREAPSVWTVQPNSATTSIGKEDKSTSPPDNALTVGVPMAEVDSESVKEIAVVQSTFGADSSRKRIEEDASYSIKEMGADAIVSASDKPRNFRLEISNGMGQRGAAHRVSAMLSSIGMKSVRLTDQRPFVQKWTQVQYSEGYQQDAMTLAAHLGASTMSISSLHQMHRVHIRVVLGKDIGKVLAVGFRMPTHM